MAVWIAALTAMLVSGLATLGVWYVHARNVNDAAYVRTVYDPVIGNLDDPNHPLLSDGRQLASPTLPAALLPFPIYRPQVSVANDSEVTQTWVNEDEAAFRYASGMRVYVKRWPAGSDPAAWYSEQKSTTGVGTVTTIGRNPAWYADANEGGPDTPKDPFVDVSIGSTDIVLSGNVQLADLLTAAANLSP
jgi:hypothetical protein